LFYYIVKNFEVIYVELPKTIYSATEEHL
jgi:hypothetical protein